MPENNELSQFQIIENRQEEVDTEGKLTFSVMSAVGMFPVANAFITIANPNEPENIIATVTTNEDGQTEDVTLQTPPFALSQTPGDERPYAIYYVEISLFFCDVRKPIL